MSSRRGTAVLPAVLTDKPAAALPPARQALDPERVRALAEKLTGKNWRTVKTDLLILTGTSTPGTGVPC